MSRDHNYNDDEYVDRYYIQKNSRSKTYLNGSNELERN